MLVTKIGVLCLVVVSSGGAQERIGKRIEGMQQALRDQPIALQGFGDLGANVGGQLKGADDALHAGRPYLSLERLGQATDLLGGARFTAANSAVKTLDEFDVEWRKVEDTLDVPAHDWRSSPAAVRAIAETAGVRAVPLLEGGRGFALATGPHDGLFYLGEAQGEADFARFCATLNLPRKGRAIALRSLLPELAALQEKVNAAFVPPRSIDQHPRFIALNSTIKLARELDAAKLYAGALYQYLEAVRHFGMLDAGAPDRATAKQALAKFDLSKSKDDDSILGIFLERAAAQVEGSDDEVRSARMIATVVAPAYFAVRKGAAAKQRAPGKTVQITLVRWPYT